MGGMARDRLRQGSAYRRTGGGDPALPEMRPDGRVASVAGAAPEAAARDQSLSRPRLHQRRQSRRADFRFGGHRCAGEGGGDAAAPTAQSALRLARQPVRGARGGARRLARGAHGRQKARGRGAGAARARRNRQDAARDRICVAPCGRSFGAPVRPRRRPGGPECEPRRARRRKSPRPAREGGARGRGEDRGGSALARGPSDLASYFRQRGRRGRALRGDEAHAAAQGAGM